MACCPRPSWAPRNRPIPALPLCENLGNLRERIGGCNASRTDVTNQDPAKERQASSGASVGGQPQVQCSAVAGNRFLQIPMILEDVAQVVVRLGEVRPQLQRPAVAGNRFGYQPQTSPPDVTVRRVCTGGKMSKCSMGADQSSCCLAKQPLWIARMATQLNRTQEVR